MRVDSTKDMDTAMARVAIQLWVSQPSSRLRAATIRPNSLYWARASEASSAVRARIR